MTLVSKYCTFLVKNDINIFRFNMAGSSLICFTKRKLNISILSDMSTLKVNYEQRIDLCKRHLQVGSRSFQLSTPL